MGWHGHLRLDYGRDTLAGAPRTVAHDRHYWLLALYAVFLFVLFLRARRLKRRTADLVRAAAARRAMISAAIETAVSSGVRAPRSRPMGLDSRPNSVSVSPASRNLRIRSWWVRREPITPM